MDCQINETPLRFHLHGKSAAWQQDRVPEIGMGLMNDVWSVVKAAAAPNTGVNHWVYLASGRMFVGVELLPDATPPQELEALDFTLTRYLKHVHVGPYHELPGKWQALKQVIAARGEAIQPPSLEIYHHHHDDPATLETTILIGLPEAAA